ncbi:MAG: hypothetical protein R6W66_07225, partial [Pelovirga sp.]
MKQELDTEAVIRELQEENDLLLAQLHMVQEELEQMFLAQNRAASVTTQSDYPGSPMRRPFAYEELLHDKTINIPAAQQIQTLEKQLSQLQTSTSWRLSWPVRFFGSVVRGRLPKKQKANRGKTDEQYIESLERKIEQIQSSRSWRITAPVRNIRLLFRSNHPQMLSWQKKSQQDQRRIKKLFEGLNLAKDDNINLLNQVDQFQQQISALKRQSSHVEADYRAQLERLRRDKAEEENKLRKELEQSEEIQAQLTQKLEQLTQQSAE